MTPADLAQARCLGYGLLADVLIRGVADTNRTACASIPELASAMGERSDDALAAELEQAFGWAAPPFEGAFLEASRVVGGEPATRLWELFREAGFEPDLRRVDIEHLTTAMRALAFLSGAEADAIEDAHAGAVERTRELARRIQDEHLLRWVPVWAARCADWGRGCRPRSSTTWRVF